MLNQVLTNQQFLASLGQDYINKSAKKATSKNLAWGKLYEVMRARQDKNKETSDQYFNCNIFLGIHKKTGSLVYFNLDAMIGQTASKLDIESNVNPFAYLDKFYGYGQSYILKTRIYPVTKDQLTSLQILNEFRKSYYHQQL